MSTELHNVIIVNIITLIIFLFFISSLIPIDSVKINETLGNVSWTNENLGSQFITIERGAPISGNASLRVDVHPSDVPDKRFNSSWSIISTDFIPIRDDAHYNYSLDVSAREVNQLHAKIYYYNSSKSEIPWEEYIFNGTDGSFKGTFTFDSFPQKQAAYLKLQMWVRQNLQPSSYLLDDIIIAETTR